MIPGIIALAHRANTSVIDVIVTLDTSRFSAIINSTGDENMTVGYNMSSVGNTIWNIAGVYTDAVGVIAFVIFFSIPFIFSWYTHSDLLPAGIFGAFVGLFMVGFLPAPYFFVGLVFIALSIATVVWSLYQKRG